jgi:hypothetical protein
MYGAGGQDAVTISSAGARPGGTIDRCLEAGGYFRYGYEVVGGVNSPGLLLQRGLQVGIASVDKVKPDIYGSGYGLSAEVDDYDRVKVLAGSGASGFSVSQTAARDAFRDAVDLMQNDGLDFDDNDLGWFCSYADNPASGEFYSLSSARIGNGEADASDKDGTLAYPNTPTMGSTNGSIESALTATVYFRHSIGGEKGTKETDSTNYTVSTPTITGAGVSFSTARQASKTGRKTDSPQQNVYGDDGNGVFTVTFSNPATTSATICQSITCFNINGVTHYRIATRYGSPIPQNRQQLRHRYPNSRAVQVSRRYPAVMAATKAFFA